MNYRKYEEKRRLKKCNEANERKAIIDAIKRGKLAMQDVAALKVDTDGDRAFTNGLIRETNGMDIKPWRCNGCGGMISPNFTRCVKCGVEDVLRRATAEQLLFEITL